MLDLLAAIGILFGPGIALNWWQKNRIQRRLKRFAKIMARGHWHLQSGHLAEAEASLNEARRLTDDSDQWFIERYEYQLAKKLAEGWKAMAWPEQRALAARIKAMRENTA